MPAADGKPSLMRRSVSAAGMSRTNIRRRSPSTSPTRSIPDSIANQLSPGAPNSAVVRPITWPWPLTTGPPEKPIKAPARTTSPSPTPRSRVSGASTEPGATARPSPSGPRAHTGSPTSTGSGARGAGCRKHTAVRISAKSRWRLIARSSPVISAPSGRRNPEPAPACRSTCAFVAMTLGVICRPAPTVAPFAMMVATLRDATVAVGVPTACSTGIATQPVSVAKTIITARPRVHLPRLTRGRC